MAATKTDSSYLGDKVALRMRHSPWPQQRAMNVLDLFGGRGVVWRAVSRKFGHAIERVSVDQRHDLDTFHLHGNNLKVLAGMDLRKFDVIDVDAYGVPCAQLTAIFEAQFRGTVFVTMIQTMYGRMPHGIMREIGLPMAVSAKAPTLVARRGWAYFKEWLAIRGVRSIIHRSSGRKHYLVFAINGAEGLGADCHSQQGGSAANHV